MIRYINKDILNTFFNQFWRLLSGPIILLLIPVYLTAEQQGYWFTFSSLAALAIFADLGFSNIALQFAAHEFAYLSFDQEGELVGATVRLERLASLFLFCLKWVLGMALIVFPVILVIGILILSQKGEDKLWLIPWLLYGTSSAIVFINSMILSFFEGCDSVSKVQKIRFKLAVLSSISIIVGLVMQIDLYALALSLVVNAFAGLYFIFCCFFKLIKKFLDIARDTQYQWRTEFLSLLWKYAISWASGYFIFQIYTPLTFHFYGAIEAGKVGLSLNLWMAIFGVANIWIQANTPKFNMYISKKEWDKLDATFTKNAMLTLGTFLVGTLGLFIFLHFFNGIIGAAERVVSNFSMFFLGGIWLVQSVINCFSVYLRAHKEEPLMLPSLFSAVYVVVTTFLSAKFLAKEYLFLGTFSSCFWILPWITYIFSKRRIKHRYE